MPLRVFFCLCLLACLYGTGAAQSRSGQSPIAGADRSSSGSESGIMMGTPEAEMMARRDIKVAEKQRLENLERAREATQLSEEIQEAFDKHQSLGRTELKKLERLEKLTRRIREQAGGSSGEVTVEYQAGQLGSILGKLSELVEALRKGVEKTPRQVISALVIERANEVLEMIRLVRSISRSDN